MSLRHAILGFLALKPMTGYDLRKAFDASAAYFWPADQAQIYRTLAKLVEDGLVSVETEAQDARPNRRVHTILPDGVADLDGWLAGPMPPTPTRDPFLLKLFLGGRLGRLAMLQLLEDRLGEIEDLIARFEVIEAATRAAGVTGLEARLRLATLENGLTHARAERDWAEALRDDLAHEETDNG